jgi:hypothetical protein
MIPSKVRFALASVFVICSAMTKWPEAHAAIPWPRGEILLQTRVCDNANICFVCPVDTANYACKYVDGNCVTFKQTERPAVCSYWWLWFLCPTKPEWSFVDHRADRCVFLHGVGESVTDAGPGPGELTSVDPVVMNWLAFRVRDNAIQRRTKGLPAAVYLLGVKPSSHCCSSASYPRFETTTRGWDDWSVQNDYFAAASTAQGSLDRVVAHSMGNSILAGACAQQGKCVHWIAIQAPTGGSALVPIIKRYCNDLKFDALNPVDGCVASQPNGDPAAPIAGLRRGSSGVHIPYVATTPAPSGGVDMSILAKVSFIAASLTQGRICSPGYWSLDSLYMDGRYAGSHLNVRTQSLGVSLSDYTKALDSTNGKPWVSACLCGTSAKGQTELFKTVAVWPTSWTVMTLAALGFTALDKLMQESSAISDGMVPLQSCVSTSATTPTAFSNKHTERLFAASANHLDGLCMFGDLAPAPTVGEEDLYTAFRVCEWIKLQLWVR